MCVCVVCHALDYIMYDEYVMAMLLPGVAILCSNDNVKFYFISCSICSEMLQFVFVDQLCPTWDEHPTDGQLNF